MDRNTDKRSSSSPRDQSSIPIADNKKKKLKKLDQNLQVLKISEKEHWNKSRNENSINAYHRLLKKKGFC